MNDLRPIALTVVPTKVSERLFLKHPKPSVVLSLHPLQFAYNANDSCEDTIIVLLQHLYPHLEHPGSSAPMIFFYSSSALNTIQPHILAKILIKMNSPHGFNHWTLAYPKNRTQSACLDRHWCSDVITTNTGAPQGTILASIIITLYTAD